MPIYFKIETERRRVTSVAIGTLIDDDLTQHQQSLAEDPDFDPSHQQLFDFTPSDEIRITYAALASTAANSLWEPGAKRAFVVKSSIGDSMLQLFKNTLGEDRGTIEVFRSKDDAMAWLEDK
ncbi:MAG: hypothetical protein OES38_12185 [Gammaproteobacteria bacterium]|nr:hypothetical protein [Gammaproteobacteria bacterium]